VKHQILRLGKDSLIYGLGSVITRFIGLLMLPLFTAYLKPKEYGVLSMLALLTMVAQPVFSLGLSAAMGPSYFDGNNPHTKSEAVWTVFTINMISASLLVALAWTFPEILGQLVRLPAEYAFLVGLTLTGSALTILVTSFTQQVQFEKHARLYILVTIATSLTAIFLSVLMVVFLGWGVQGMVVGQLAGNIVTFFAFLLIGFNATKPAISMDMAKKLLRQGLPLVPSFAFLFILMHANKFILEREAGLGVVGIYSIGFNLGAPLFNLE
jgi:O-antigen/teichoic acid export membrane protein